MELRNIVGAHNDAELASKFGVDKSTVSGWRSRGRLPARYRKVLGADAVPSVDVWPELHDRGTAVALARYAILRNEVAMGGNIDQAISAFFDVKPFWFVMHRAVYDLRAKMNILNIDLQAAALMLLQEDLRNPQETARRVAAVLAEDIADSPELKD